MLKKDEIIWLTPEKGNVHSFTALENSAILDILAPDYDNNARYCNFYKEIEDNQTKKSIINCFEDSAAGVGNQNQEPAKNKAQILDASL